MGGRAGWVVEVWGRGTGVGAWGGEDHGGASGRALAEI